MSKLIATLVASLFAAAAFAQTNATPLSQPPSGTGAPARMEMKKDDAMMKKDDAMMKKDDKMAMSMDKKEAAKSKRAARKMKRAEKVGNNPTGQ